MSVRSFRRAHERRVAREARRAGLLARRGRLLAGATLGASALMVANAQAATYTVTTTDDDAAPGVTCPTPSTCVTLRDALYTANKDSSADTIVFQSGLSGMITLTGGALPIDNPNGVTIEGPGSGTLTVSGNNTSQVFTIPNTTTAAIGALDAISGLTITNGAATSNTTTPGGAIDEPENGKATPIPLSLSGDVISDSTSLDGAGGIYTQAALAISDSTITGNTAPAAGGIAGMSLYHSPKYGQVITITDSQITDNHATSGSAGGVEAVGAGLTVKNSIVSGNTSTDDGGGIASESKYGTTIRNSTVSDNTAGSGGGGIAIATILGAHKYSPTEILDSTISGNQAPDGAGIELYEDTSGSPMTIDASTISGNSGGAGSFGGGLLIAGQIGAPVRLEDSTISGNSAATGGGVSLGYSGHKRLILINPNTGIPGSISFDNSTISGNTATSDGGGIYLGEYVPNGASAYTSGTAAIRSTIVSGNTAAGSPEDLARASASTGGGFTSAFSLVQRPGAAPLAQTETITGTDPDLGPLANNGGPAETMLPAANSLVVDQGHDYDDLTVDQLGNPRTVDVPWVANPPGGDGTDIGSIEIPQSGVAPPPPAPNPGFGAAIRATPLGGSASPLLVEGQTPVSCTVDLGTLASCVIQVTMGTTTIADGGVAGSGASLTTTIESTAAFQKYLLQHYPLGLTAGASAAGTTSLGDEMVTGHVRLLGGPSITLSSGKPTTKLTSKLKGELREVATLLGGARTVACTVYAKQSSEHAGKGKHGQSEQTVVKNEAKAACAQLRRDGLSARYSSTAAVSKGNPGGSRLVIAFGF